MAIYTVTVAATSNTSAGTFDNFVQITGATSTRFKIRRIKAYYFGGSTAVADNEVNLKICLLSAAGTGSTTGTIVKLDPLMPSATSTAAVKNGTAAFTTGTVTSTISQVGFNERSYWEWTASSEGEEYNSGSAGILAVQLASSAASRVYAVEVEFEE